MLNLIRRIISRHSPRSRGQSFLELALVLPILLLMLLGLVEVAFFMSKYLDGLDLTREAARFASIRDPSISGDYDCSTSGSFDFFWDTSCIFSRPLPYDASDLTNPDRCSVPITLSPGHVLNWCNGLNKYLAFNPATDDVVISAYTVDENNIISDTHPINNGNEWVVDPAAPNGRSYYWALSNHITTGTTASPLVNNFQKNCRNTADPSKTPYYTYSNVKAKMALSNSDFPAAVAPAASPGMKGFIAVELFYCHTQTLGLPVFTIFVPNPIMLHVFTLMPLPSAAPTPTPDTP